MNYQISSIGIGIIAVYSIVILLVVAWPLAKLFGAMRWKWLLIAPPVLALLAAPWAEEYWIAKNFYEACQDAGVHVVRQVEVEGFLDATGTSERDRELSSEPKLLYDNPLYLAEWDKRGYRFEERLFSDGSA